MGPAKTVLALTRVTEPEFLTIRWRKACNKIFPDEKNLRIKLARSVCNTKDTVSTAKFNRLFCMLDMVMISHSLGTFAP